MITPVMVDCHDNLFNYFNNPYADVINFHF